jgi:hypothetical protein
LVDNSSLRLHRGSTPDLESAGRPSSLLGSETGLQVPRILGSSILLREAGGNAWGFKAGSEGYPGSGVHLSAFCIDSSVSD